MQGSSLMVTEQRSRQSRGHLLKKHWPIGMVGAWRRLPTSPMLSLPPPPPRHLRWRPACSHSGNLHILAWCGSEHPPGPGPSGSFPPGAAPALLSSPQCDNCPVPTAGPRGAHLEETKR